MRQPRTYLVQMTNNEGHGANRRDEGIVRVQARYAAEAKRKAERGKVGVRSWYVVGTESEVET